jgi:predicted permease
MAPGVNAYLFANMYGVARRVAATSVLVATLASILTVPVWLALLG